MGNNAVHSTEYGNEGQAIMTALKNSQELKIKVPEYPLDGKVVKSITLASLQKYSEYILSDYYLELKRFTQGYDTKRLNMYLQATFSEFLQEEKLEMNLSNMPTASSSPQINDSSEPFFVDKQECAEYARTFQDLDKLQESGLKSPKKHCRVMKKLMQFVEDRISSPHTFFSEFTDVFANLFVKKYQACILGYRKTSENLKSMASMDKVFTPICEIPTVRRKRSSTVKIQQSRLKETAVAKYNEAKTELKNFQAIYQNVLKEFIGKIFCHINKEQDFKISKCSLEKISSKILFENSRCYWTYFELIRYNLMEEETLLKPFLAKLQNLLPKDFEIIPQFCLAKAVQPYEQAISSLDNLERCLNPYSKFEVIGQFREEISKSVENYYKNEGHEDERSELTADDIMSIYCYCMAKAKNKNLRAHQVFIEDFVSDSELKYGEKAYYFSTFIGALNFLVNMANSPISNEEFELKYF